MAYEYVTDNNLYEKQNYMYSEYRGMDFLRDYLDSRRWYIDSISYKNDGREATSHEEGATDPVQSDLMQILHKLESGECDRELTDRMNAYTKSFEVRKRIYSDYDSRWKPVEGAGFESYLSYLLFADCLLHMYKHTECLKYFSCLLKVDDTMLSVSSLLPEELTMYLRTIIVRELEIFELLLGKSDIDLGVMG